MGMYVAYAFFEFRETGDLVLPILGLPERVHLLARPTLASASVLVVLLGVAVGVTVYGLIFRLLRRSPVLARVVVVARSAAVPPGARCGCGSRSRAPG